MIAIHKPIVFPKKDGYIIFKSIDIRYFEGEKSSSIIHTTDNKKYLLSIALKEVEHLIPIENFSRSHELHIVNLAYIMEINSKKLTIHLDNGVILPIEIGRLKGFLQVTSALGNPKLILS